MHKLLAAMLALWLISAWDGMAENGAAAESRAVESGAAESGAAESGAAESGAAESGAAESGAAESGAAESGALLAGELKSLVRIAPAERPAAEMRLATALSSDGAGGAAAYGRLESLEHKRALLRLMSLSGNPEFLPIIHQELQRGGALADAALTAAAALGRRESADYVRPYLQSGGSQAAVLALSYFTAAAAPPRLADLAPLRKLHDPFVRAALIRLLLRRRITGFAGYCLHALADSREIVRLPAVGCVGAAEDGAPPLVAAFASASPQIQLEIIAVLSSRHGARSGPLFRKWLRHGRRRVALRALIALQGLDGGPTVPVLMGLIEDGGSSLPEQVLVKSLGLFRDGRALGFLGQRLSRAISFSEKIALITALGDLGLLAGQAYLLEYVSHTEPKLRRAAREALKRIAEHQPQ